MTLGHPRANVGDHDAVARSASGGLRTLVAGTLLIAIGGRLAWDRRQVLLQTFKVNIPREVDE